MLNAIKSSLQENIVTFLDCCVMIGIVVTAITLLYTYYEVQRGNSYGATGKIIKSIGATSIIGCLDLLCRGGVDYLRSFFG
jgi:hypothetical protein